jgi:hypothetical protein
MERHHIIEMMHELKLAGVRVAFDEILAAGLRRQHSVPQIIGDLLQAEIAETQARSVKYQIAIARLPLAKELATFDFNGTPVNEALVRDLATGAFLQHQRNAVLVGGTGSGKTHLAVAIARNCLRNRLTNKRRPDPKMASKPLDNCHFPMATTLKVEIGGWQPWWQASPKCSGNHGNPVATLLATAVATCLQLARGRNGNRQGVL